MKNDRVLKSELQAKMKEVLEPRLRFLNFISPGKASKDQFPALWLRDRESELDGILFQWDRYGRPSFIINFRSFSHPDDLAKCRASLRRVDPTDFGLRAYMKAAPRGWFKPGLLDRVFRADSGIASVVDTARSRLVELSDFCTGAAPAAFLYDCISWEDKRLPDNPPPWNDGPVGSQYHLPPRRASNVKYG